MVLWDEEGSGYGDGYGYGEESGPIIEQTSSSLSHYEIMTLARFVFVKGLSISTGAR